MRNVRYPPIADTRLRCEAAAMKVCLLVLAGAVLTGCVASSSADPKPSLGSELAPYELWMGGDDGLTQRLAAAVRKEFDLSGLFTAIRLSEQPNGLKVTIPTHAGWKEVRGEQRITYKLRIERAGRLLARTRGSCWERELAVCARQIVQTAARAEPTRRRRLRV